MKKMLFYLLFLTCSSSLFGGTTDTGNIPNFVVLCIPSSGSALLFKALQRMTGLKGYKVPSDVDLTHHIRKPNQYPIKYFSIPNSLIKKDIKNTKLKKLILVRDLRDVTLSSVLHLEYKLSDNWLSKDLVELYCSLPFHKKLIFFMIQNAHYSSSLQSISQQVLKYISFVQTKINKNVLVCHFENLLGPQGGGTSTTQRKELEKIAQFLNISLNSHEIEKIAETLFGIDELLDYEWKKKYYRAGRIGGWKQFFTADVLEFYDHSLKEYNKKLGYK